MKHTIYIAPGYNFCNVYHMPYGMRPGQSPNDLAFRYQSEWVLIGQLNQQLKLRFLDADFGHLKDDIEGQMGGTFFEIEPVFTRTQSALKTEAPAKAQGPQTTPLRTEHPVTL